MFTDLIAQKLWPDRFIDLTAKKCGKIGSYMLLPKLCGKIGSQILLPKKCARQILQCYLQNLWQDRFPTAKKCARQILQCYLQNLWQDRFVDLTGTKLSEDTFIEPTAQNLWQEKTNRSYQHKIVGRQVQLPTNF